MLLQILKQTRLLAAKCNNDKVNAPQITHDYKVGDQILIVHSRSEQTHTRKLNSPTKGPFVVTKVYKNGMVEIQRKGFFERIIFHQIKPYQIEVCTKHFQMGGECHKKISHQRRKIRKSYL